jgi:ribulose-phosphate 3-epimerase
MHLIPTINEQSFEAIKEKVKIVENLVDMIQLDIADGKFTSYKTWDNPEDLLTLNGFVQFEIHLMVEKPVEIFERWLKIPTVKRIIIHVETITEKDFAKIYTITNQYQKELGLAIESKTPWEALEPYLASIKFVQILAVSAGPAGQTFEFHNLEKIKSLKNKYPNLIIEVDGGVNNDTAPLIKAAGADIICSSSYLFSDINKVEEKIKFLENI